MGQVAERSRELSGQLGQQGGQMLAGLQQGGAFGQGAGMAGIAGGLGAMGDLAAGNTQGQQLMAQQASGSSPVLGAQIGQLGQDLSKFFSQSLMPGIQGEAVAVNAMGNPRQGIAQGLAAQGVTDAFGRGVTDLRTADYQNQLGAAQALTQSQGMGAQGLSNLGLGSMGLGQQGYGQGMASLSGLYGLGMSPFSAQWSPLQNLAGIIGGPTVLGQSQSTNSSSSWNAEGSFGLT
jgi:hypothetical protein